MALLGQGINCAASTPFCIPVGTSFNYANTVGGAAAQSGPAYGCLYSEPNPGWFYVETSGSGIMTFQIQQGSTLGANNLDVDFICWGPYTGAAFANACSNLTGTCGGSYSSTTNHVQCSGNIVDCSYSTAAVEMLTINSPGPGSYYIVLVTNYSNGAGFIGITQTSGSANSCCPLAGILASKKNICLGDSTTLSASTGNNGMLYTWNTATDTISTDTIPYITISPTVTTTYTLTATPTTGTCGVSMDTLSVIVHQPATLAVNSGTICTGAHIALNASGSANYTWTPSTGLNNTASASVTANPTTTTVYTVTGDCPNSSITTTVTVNAMLAFSVHGNIAVICPGSADTLSVTGPAYTYAWAPAAALNTDTGTTVIASPTTTTIYTVTASDAYCSANQYITVSDATPLSTPVLANNSSNQVTACQQSNVVLSLTQSSSLNEFIWYRNGSYFDSTTGPVLLPSFNVDTNIYSVIDSTACGVSAALTVTVIIAPTPVSTVSVTSQSNCSLCNGSAIVFPSAGTAPYRYSWSSGDTAQSVNDLCVGNGSCYIYDQNNCTAYSSFTINANATIPFISFSITQDSTPHYWDVYPSISGGIPPYTYLWTWGDGTSDSTLYASHIYSSPGNYVVCLSVSDFNGCVNQYCLNDSLYRTTGIVHINVINSATGVASVSKDNDVITVYPNPNNGSFIIETNNTIKQTIRLFDINGKMVLNNTIQGKSAIDASSISEGVYNLSIIGSQGVTNTKLIIVR